SPTAREIVNVLLTKGREQQGLRCFKFYIDMYQSLREMYRVMKKNAKCAIVIGNNHFTVNDGTIEVPNDRILLELAKAVGFMLDKLIGRELQKSSEGYIREESILILKKVI
ncbi:MAG: hypothetical protein QXE27_08235, partial [Thermoplasmata archaeon]